MVFQRGICGGMEMDWNITDDKYYDNSTSMSENDVEKEHATFVTYESSEELPKIGMLFSNEDEAFKFYNAYAKMIGFSVRKDKYRRLADGSIRKRSFVCSKHGLRRSMDPSDVRKVKWLETRTGCLAMVEFTIEDDHNHQLVKQNQQDMLRSHRQMDEAQASIVDTMDNAGIKPHNIFSYMVEQAGGAENVGFLKKDCDNFLRDKRGIFFKLEMHKMTLSLTQFVLRYEKILERRRRSELLKDFQSNQCAPISKGKLGGIAKQASIEYTNVMFEEFQKELWESLSLAIEEVGTEESFHIYKLVRDGDNKRYIVKFRDSDCFIDCTCKKFESVGILCLHALKVLNFRNIFVLPPQYILKRWTKGAKDGLGTSNDCKSIVSTTTKEINLQMSQIMQKAMHFASKGALAIDTAEMAEKILEEGLKGGETDGEHEQEKEEKDDEEKNNDGKCESSELHVFDPPCVRLKGVSNARMKSQLEKKKRKKRIQIGHSSDHVGKTNNQYLTGANQGQRSKKGPAAPVLGNQSGPSNLVAQSNVNMNFGIQVEESEVEMREVLCFRVTEQGNTEKKGKFGEYGIPARMEHYACMVDLFGRAGRLSEAFKTIQSMPFSPDAGVWGTLLGACRVHGNVELAEVASKHLFKLDPQNSGYYILKYTC
ncbi:hypothetical protein FNV43_RR17643 [Rhamnella rubrinervis]|uniref:SWIM-type domain-containing protein n=1 Tax=Rhamnella rubrinervis TaxID=2594499 RepID=A0A8K0E2Z6_9ROSA|nr:hypothetical protein FNV43_RR17643 [Rhamnella rubrinervis]